MMEAFWNWLIYFPSLIVVIVTLIALLKTVSKTPKSSNELVGPDYWPLIGNIGSFRKLPHGYSINVGLQQGVFGFQELYPQESIVMVVISVVKYAFIIKADAAEVLLSSHKEITKSREYSFLESWLGLGLLTSTGAKWKKRRRMLTPSFHFRVLTDSQAVINEHGLAFVQHLSKRVDEEHVDILRLLTMCTLDVICETAMGVHIDAQNNSDSAYVRGLDDFKFGTLEIDYKLTKPFCLSRIAVERSTNVLHFNDTIFGLTPTGRTYKNALKIVHDFTKNIIKKRIGERMSSSNPEIIDETIVKKRLAFLDLLVDEHFKNPEEFQESDIQEEVDTFMFEGHDTTAVGLSWCMYLLGHHPDIQERLRNEILEVLGQDKEITETELKELKYLECVIKESQRMFPSVPFIGRKLEDDLIICGKLVPKGTNCFVSIAVMHRDPSVFPEPHKFDPDRFTMENSSRRHPYGYIPFSAGPRNCIGQKFALNEEKTLMAHVIRNFTWKSLDPMDKVTFSPNLVSRPIPAHRIKLFKR